MNEILSAHNALLTKLTTLYTPCSGLWFAQMKVRIAINQDNVMELCG